jgi:cysteine-rich secretory family protein
MESGMGAFVSASLVACILAAGLASGCNSSSKSPTAPAADPYASARVQAVAKINSFRSTVSLPPLAHWSAADSCADAEAKHDSEVGTAHASFPSCGEQAQNECPGWPSADAIVTQCLQQMWNEGPGADYSTHGHYINMTNTSYTKVSIGFYTTPGGSVWSVQNFRQ